jgi:putative ABC transport system permease protein
MRVSTLSEVLWRDLRHAVRSLSRSPGFTSVSVLCLALGIGANATMFGVADRLFLRPPPGIHEPAGVVRVYIERNTGGIRTPGGGPGSYPDFQDLNAGATAGVYKAFTAIAAFSSERFDYGVGAAARRVDGQAVTARYFDVLHARPSLGRFFLPEEDSIVSANLVAVVSHSFWQGELGADPHAVGRTIKIDGRDFTVIGVAERGFSGFDLQPLDVWIPLHALPNGPGPDAFTERRAIWLAMVARLAPGVSPPVAQSRATTVKRQVDATAAPEFDKNVRVTTGPLLEADGPQRSPSASIALWLLGAVGLVLFIACANVANLLLVRGARRRREIALRLSLGARRAQLVRPLLVENFVLAVVGGGLGLVLSLWSAGVVRVFALPTGASAVDGHVLAFTIAVSVITALVSGLVPALMTTRADIAMVLKGGSRRSGHSQSRTQSVLLVVQTALSLVVLTGAGLFIRSLHNVRAIDLGLDSDHIILATLDRQGSTYDSVARDELTHRVIARLAALPGVVGVSYVGLPPFQGLVGLRVRLVGRDSSQLDQRGMFANFVGPDYLRANGTPLRRGRDFGDADRANTLPVVIINETMARRLWPGQDPIGQCIQISMRPPMVCRYVIGVMGDGKYVSMTERPLAYYLLPYSQINMGLPPTLVIRSGGDAHRLVPDVRQVIANTASDLPNVDVRPLSDEIDPQLQPYRIGAVLFTLFGLVALALAAMGLYGVVAYVVTQRTQEAGVRLALGARGGTVLGLMVRQGMQPALLGAAIGVVGALLVTRLFRSQLYGVSPTDPLTLVAVALALCAVAALACYVPARRALRIDPVIALRSE